MKHNILPAVRVRFLIVFVVGCVILFAGGLLAVNAWLPGGRSGLPASITATPVHDDSARGLQAPPTDTPVPSPTPLVAWEGSERLNILIMAIDQRPDGDPNKSNTDTMILCTLDPATQSAGMLSIPRDLYVTLTGHGEGRINTALALGGPEYAMREVGRVVDIPIQHYVRVNFNTLTSLIDLVGGVDVDVDADINDPTYPNMDYGYDPFVLSKGMQHLDGATALKYARTRHGSSDIVRMRRQQQLIMAMREQIMKPGSLAKITLNMPLVVDVLSRSIKSDLSLSEIIQLGLFAKDLPPERITRVVMDETVVQGYTTPTGGQVLLLIPNRIQKLSAKLLAPPELDASSSISTTLGRP
jgi:LCP family protein required for cell wall assembly